jgi:thiamine biosynthesis lipoprotein
MVETVPEWTDRTFRVMGTRARVIVPAAAAPRLDAAVDRARDHEARWSRFEPASELSLLNAATGPAVVPADTFALVARAVDAWARTDGRFDPTGLAAVRAAGYDADFATVAAREPAAAVAPAPGPLPGCGGIVLDPIVSSIRLPAGVALDLGGIGKGWTADAIVTDLLASGAAGACVDLGGDVRVGGTGPYDGAWDVGFTDADLGDRFGRVRLGDGGVATSTTRRRRWQVGDETRHHLIDPRTGEPSRSGVASTTVVAAETWWAEVLAKAALIAGVDDGLALLERERVDGVLVTDAGTVHPTAGFAAWCTTAPVTAG